MYAYVNSAPKGVWYSDCITHIFKVKKVTVPVSGHVHTLNLYEVIEGEHSGDFIAPVDAELL